MLFVSSAHACSNVTPHDNSPERQLLLFLAEESRFLDPVN